MTQSETTSAAGGGESQRLREISLQQAKNCIHGGTATSSTADMLRALSNAEFSWPLGGGMYPHHVRERASLLDAAVKLIDAAPAALQVDPVIYQYREIGEGEGWRACSKDFHDHLQCDPNMDTRTVPAPSRQSLVDENERLRTALNRTRNVLGNMALENESGWRAVFARWPIHHEPLRSDARALLPIIDAVLEDRS